MNGVALIVWVKVIPLYVWMLKIIVVLMIMKNVIDGIKIVQFYKKFMVVKQDKIVKIIYIVINV